MKRNFTKLLSLALAAIMIFSVSSVLAFAAEERTVRTTPLDITAFDYTADYANEAEGWSWDAETGKLTLDNVNINVEDASCILMPHNIPVHIVLVGDNFLKSGSGNATISNKKGFSDYPITISGDNLTIETNSYYGAIAVAGIKIESGNITANGTITAQNIIINSGSVNIDVLDKSEDEGYGLYALETITINGGTHTVRCSEVALTALSNGMSGGNALVINGGDLVLEGGVAAIWTGALGRATATVNSDGKISIENSGMGFYSQDGDIIIEKGVIKAVNTAEDKLFRVISETDKVLISPADYSAVDAAVAKLPENLDDYTEESAAAVQAAVDAVDRDLKCIDQDIVDGYAADIEAALEGLEEDVCWLVKIFRAITNFFVNTFKSIFGFIFK